MLLKNPAPPVIAGLLAPPFSPGLQKRLLSWINFLQLKNWNTVVFYFKIAMALLAVLVIYKFFYLK